MTLTATTRSKQVADTTTHAPQSAQHSTLTTADTLPPHACTGCPTRWTGTQTAHCPTCHRTFTRPSAFDRHRRGGTCHPPPDVGLTASGRRTNHTTIWGYPGGSRGDWPIPPWPPRA